MKLKYFIKRLSPSPYTLSPRGFTLPEVVIVIGIMLTMLGIGTLTLVRAQNQNYLSSTLDTVIADLREQQIKAMVGATEGSGSAASYGIHVEGTSYTLFRSAYGTANYVVTLPPTVQITTTFANAQVLFAQGSGETGSSGTITLFNTANNEQKTITVNRYGIVTGIN